MALSGDLDDGSQVEEHQKNLEDNDVFVLGEWDNTASTSDEPYLLQSYATGFLVRLTTNSTRHSRGRYISFGTIRQQTCTNKAK